VEAIATQVLVIFLIRTGGKPWASMPHPILAVTSLGALGVALFLALGPFAGVFGFGVLPGWMLAVIAALVVGYLACAQMLKPLATRHGR
jgi:Mg2+-importing ATPase